MSRKWIGIVAALVALFYLLTQPVNAATAVNRLLDSIFEAFTAIITFISALFS